MNPNHNQKERNLDLPYDTSLPFFAYGIFKPGELAYSKIRNHVKTVNDAEINYGMKYRDGVPILIAKENNCHPTNGFLITFKEGHEEEAYRIISKNLLRKLYKWRKIKINGEKVNVVFGVNPGKGSYPIKKQKDRFRFNGQNDPLFNEALQLIEKNLNSKKDSGIMESFFELQMNYMLLWSAIDRYSSIRYNKRKEKWNRERFAKEKAFKEGIKKFENKYHRPVYSTKKLEKHEFNAEDPEETIEYYYTLRCNVVHRGKEIISDYELLENATKELLEIFNDVLENTFDEDYNDKVLNSY